MQTTIKHYDIQNDLLNCGKLSEERDDFRTVDGIEQVRDDEGVWWTYRESQQAVWDYVSRQMEFQMGNY